jgi:hypothetical protein
MRAAPARGSRVRRRRGHPVPPQRGTRAVRHAAGGRPWAPDGGALCGPSRGAPRATRHRPHLFARRDEHACRMPRRCLNRRTTVHASCPKTGANMSRLIEARRKHAHRPPSPLHASTRAAQGPKVRRPAPLCGRASCCWLRSASTVKRCRRQKSTHRSPGWRRTHPWVVQDTPLGGAGHTPNHAHTYYTQRTRVHTNFIVQRTQVLLSPAPPPLYCPH